MPGRARPLLVYVALLAALFAGGAAAGYVYQHEPLPYTLHVRVDPAPPPPGTRLISGTVTGVDGGRLVIATDAGPLTLPFAAGLAVDDLRRAPEGLAAGTPVNVGVESTAAYGLVLTGVVAVEAAPR